MFTCFDYTFLGVWLLRAAVCCLAGMVGPVMSFVTAVPTSTQWAWNGQLVLVTGPRAHNHTAGMQYAQ